MVNNNLWHDLQDTQWLIGLACCRSTLYPLMARGQNVKWLRRLKAELIIEAELQLSLCEYFLHHYITHNWNRFFLVSRAACTTGKVPFSKMTAAADRDCSHFRSWPKIHHGNCLPFALNHLDWQPGINGQAEIPSIWGRILDSPVFVSAADVLALTS